MNFLSSTVGLIKRVTKTKSKMVKVEFYESGDSVVLKLIDANSFNRIRNVSNVTISKDAYENRDKDYYNDIVEANWAFSYFGL